MVNFTKRVHSNERINLSINLHKFYRWRLIRIFGDELFVKYRATSSSLNIGFGNGIRFPKQRERDYPIIVSPWIGGRWRCSYVLSFHFYWHNSATSDLSLSLIIPEYILRLAGARDFEEFARIVESLATKDTYVCRRVDRNFETRLTIIIVV